MASSPKVKSPPATPNAINKFFKDQMDQAVPTKDRMGRLINGGCCPMLPSFAQRLSPHLYVCDMSCALTY